jgi:arylsulfatase A-like enzyme
VSEGPASFLDVFPTVCAAAGISLPADVRREGGIDLVAEVNGANRSAQRPLFFEYHYPQRGGPASLPMAIRLGKWKLFASHDFVRMQLYDLAADIGEQHDVAARRPDVVRDLRSRLEGWWKQFEGKFSVEPVSTPVPVPSPEELDKRHYRN